MKPWTKTTRTLITVGVMLICWGWGQGPAAWAQSAGTDKEEILKTVRADLAQRAKVSGTLDLYDSTLEKVRNLRLQELDDKIQVEGESGQVKGRYRDTGSGDLAEVLITVQKSPDGWAVTEVALGEVSKMDRGVAAGQEDKEYTDEEIQQAMKNYVEQQTKFTGNLMLFDTERDKMRTLEMTGLAPEVKRLGILNISRINFKDVDSGETVGVDITVENKKGSLEVQSLRVREVKKAP